MLAGEPATAISIAIICCLIRQPQARPTQMIDSRHVGRCVEHFKSHLKVTARSRPTLRGRVRRPPALSPGKVSRLGRCTRCHHSICKEGRQWRVALRLLVAAHIRNFELALPFIRITLRVLVGHHRADRVKHGAGGEVLRHHSVRGQSNPDSGTSAQHQQAGLRTSDGMSCKPVICSAA